MPLMSSHIYSGCTLEQMDRFFVQTCVSRDIWLHWKSD